MATYYVRTDGNNANTGLGSTTALAWQTITYALANMTLTNGTNYLYIAPGVYRESPTVTVTPSSTQTLVIQGDTTSSIFIGVSPGPVRITNYVNDNINPIAGTVLTCAKTYTTFRNLSFVMYGNAIFTNSEYINIDKCIFESITGSGDGLKMTANGTTSINGTITNSVFIGRFCLNICGPSTGSAFNFNVAISDCLFIGNRTILVDVSTSQFSNTVGNGLNIYNCTFYAVEGIGLFTSNATHPSTIRNCNFIGNTGNSSVGITSQGTNRQTEDFNRFSCTNARANVTAGTNSTVGTTGVDWSMSYINTLVPVAIFAPIASSPLISGGTPTGAPTTDIYGNAWTSNTDIGAFARTSLAGSSFYYPTERNASTITIAPGSTSQSIELYLGATGLTASTAGLSARYNRTRTASVNIPLVARTIGQAWISGGFAEVDAVNMPGIYRVDIPDAALAVGADDVTLVVRGASGTNGAVMTIKLSSGGLTSAQTASAVWGASVAGYVTATDFGGVINETRNVVGATEAYVLDVPNQVWEELTVNHDTHGTYGWNVLRADAPSKEGLVTLHQSGGVSRVDADIHAIVNDADAASELKGALLHNGTDYISANLLTPTSPATLLRMGPYSVVADQAKQEINIDILTGSSLPIVLQLVDVTGTGIPLVGATLSVKIYNASGTLVTTYTGTASYSDAGFLTFTLDSVVTATPGTYYLTVTRTTGATDTSIYGGLRLYVRSN